MSSGYLSFEVKLNHKLTTRVKRVQENVLDEVPDLFKLPEDNN
jgi:hypothetical protein